MKFDDLKSSFEVAPEGTHTAVLAAFIDRGEQTTKFGTRRQAILHWILPNVETANDTPCTIYQPVWNLSLRSKTFREVVNGLMGDEPLAGRSLSELVGRAAKLTIVHNEGESQTYANVAAVKALKPGTKAPRTEQELTYFSLDPDEFSEAVLAGLPEHEHSKIRSSETYKILIAASKWIAANQAV
jgi:hypothetical protein